MGIQDSLQGEFSSLPPFANALEKGVRDEISQALIPLQQELADIKNQLVTLGIAVQTAQQTADSAAQAATTPPSTPAATQSAPQSTPQSTPGTTPGTTPAITPTVTPSSKPTVFVLALAEPIFVGNILEGGTRPTATIRVRPIEDNYYVGSEIELQYSNPDSTVEFVGWYNFDTGAQLGTSNPLRTTLPAVQAFNAIAKFTLR